MARPAKWSNEAERRQAQNDRRKRERATKPVKSTREFIGIDGEGITIGRDHRYVLLGVSHSQAESPEGLTFSDISRHLWTQYLAHPDAVFVGFFLGYDFTQYLRGLPVEKANRLFHPELRVRNLKRMVDRTTGEVTETPNPLGPWPVNYQGWEFDLLGMKRFKLRPENFKNWMFVNDAGPFFQASLLSVIDPREWKEPIVSEEEYKIIEEGKKKRDTAVLDDSMRYYNALENDVLSRLMVRLDAGLQRAGVRLGKDQWFGPGQAAQAWLTKNRCPTGEMVRNKVSHDGPNGDILHKGRMTYYGGWFEIFAHGHIPGQSWEYDINSAYPYIASQLPCLLHGRWEKDDMPIRRNTRAGTYRIVHADILGFDPTCGGMLHRRKDHTIVRPYKTRGWYWEHEIAAAMRAGVIDEASVLGGVAYRVCDCPHPLHGLVGLYEERLRVGKDTPEGKAFKLIYNSVYGKFAQSIGEPKYGNSIYASLITAGCRTIILDAIATHPGGTNDLLMVATDGVYFRTRHPSLVVGKALGEWSESVKHGLTLYKPGVYWDDTVRNQIRNGDTPRFKARGISAASFASSIRAVDDHFRRWDDTASPLDYPKVTFTSGFSMITCLQALQRGKWELAGTLGHEANELCNGCTGAHLVQDSDPVSKRRGLYRTGDIWRSHPWDTGNPDSDIESIPYDRAFGQPDPDEYGITDDGTVLDSWRING